MHIPDWKVKQTMARLGCDRTTAYRYLCSWAGRAGAKARLAQQIAQKHAAERRAKAERYRRSRPDLYE